MVARKYKFTAEEYAEIRRQYEDHVPAKLIAEQWNITTYDSLYVILRRQDPAFETHTARKRNTPRWCPWCGNDIPPFAKRKYCYDQECIAERAANRRDGWNTKITCICGNKKSSHRTKCQTCENKRIAERTASRRRIITRMAREGHTTEQIATQVGLSIDRTRAYRQKLKLAMPARKGSWRPEQAAYWKYKVIEAGSAKAVWERSGITYSAFLHRLRRTGFKAGQRAVEALRNG
jgi:hypothetical protein